MSTENPRLRRARKSRAKMAELHVTRLTVYRSNSNIYAQIIDGNNNKVIATASTTEAEVKKTLKNTSNKDAAIAIGKRIAEKAVKAGVKEIAFDRSGYKYHGRIKALADSARENGLTF
ncbi:50S ribosomal protein L18 [Methylophilaceae bacterium]|jgi:large subunit ribosomal protein L18|uniref:Large ribosomal subunit protein uL18 n=1 Tax=Methylophilales bacterium HTCC2181 TaxID=383631 RepID=A0P864_9PROT|nr:50S ribosomal protein L18 [Methylophilales bacterium HTCC2181]MBT3513394.1 50S ribosomal protein L18 [Nitrosomonadales bacterium]MCH9781425.1 50S ribosomal protein L18 [Betaproteobacteria bacterium]MDA9085671.1 50S ribosomal protein L18 [Methylophilaceae bacterium]MBT6392732.1 50S ribosomal protein L18 [Nitrosomonadales bacterium]|tara:strand:+ start:2045 stop:2398 length:354 start_codon:yes stop_codon:yes gene_type:complete